jgi:hypothetical protein
MAVFPRPQQAIIVGKSTEQNYSFQFPTAPLNPEQTRRCRMLQRHGFTVIEFSDDEYLFSWNQAKWQESMIIKAMDKVASLYPEGGETKDLSAYDPNFAREVLEAAARVFPKQLGMVELKRALSPEPSNEALLVAIDALDADGYIEAKAMRSGIDNGIQDVACIRATRIGREHLSEDRGQSRPQKHEKHDGATRHAAEVLNILIASPSDVAEERDVVEKVILNWNASHFASMGVMLHPIRWESHAYPASGDRPQAIINKQIVESGDILVGIFGYKLGTPTGTAQSGTIEEIEEFRKVGKYVALYFSTANIPRSADRNQLEALETYKKERQKDTLYFEFEDASGLREHLTRHLPKIVDDVRRRLNLSSLPARAHSETSSAANAPSSQQENSSSQNPLLLADLISELDDNFDCASRLRTGDVYRRPSTRVWLENRNKISLPQNIFLDLKNMYNRIGMWADIVATGLNPNTGSMPLELIVSDLRSSLPSLIERLRKLQTRG